MAIFIQQYVGFRGHPDYLPNIIPDHPQGLFKSSAVLTAVQLDSRHTPYVWLICLFISKSVYLPTFDHVISLPLNFFIIFTLRADSFI